MIVPEERPSKPLHLLILSFRFSLTQTPFEPVLTMFKYEEKSVTNTSIGGAMNI
jgi:hypothetical protein